MPAALELKYAKAKVWPKTQGWSPRGLAGRQAIEATEAPSHFHPDKWDDYAVEYHNKKTSDLPGSFPGKSERLLKIIRDTDELDIMDLVLQPVAQDGFRELPDTCCLTFT